jgi:transcriptional regulator with XRE-family HTH domain
MRKPPDKQLLKAFGAEVKSRRASLGLSQEELAHRAGLNRTFVGKLEVAQSQPSMTVLFQLASALQLEASELVAQIARRAAREARVARQVRTPSAVGR